MKIVAGHSQSESQCYDFCKFRDMFLAKSNRFVLLVFFRDMLLFDAVCIGVILHDFWGEIFCPFRFPWLKGREASFCGNPQQLLSYIARP